MLTNYERRLIAAEYSDPAARQNAEHRVEAGEPLGYILGHWPFWRSEFIINTDCLIPRPDTEILVEAAIAALPHGGSFADLCTGSGCIGLSVLQDCPGSSAILCDIAPGALAAASENAEKLHLSDRAQIVGADLLCENPLGAGRYDLILSNPPYIPTSVIADYPDLAPEPALALDGGADGLIFYRRFIRDFAENLKDNGAFLFEIGYDQGDALSTLAADAGFICQIRKDYGGNDRVAILRKSKEAL